MPFIDYAVNNYCKRCDLRFSKEEEACTICNHQLRKAARKTKKNKVKFKNE